LVLIIDATLSWHQHIDLIATRRHTACYVLRTLEHIVPQSTGRKIYYAYFHSFLKYSIIFGRNSSNVNKLIILQKKIVRILSTIGAKVSCKEVFKNLESMTLHSQYIFSLIIVRVDYKQLFTPNNGSTVFSRP
jgi:hypothetical protein